MLYLETSIFINLEKIFNKGQDVANSRHIEICLIKRYVVINLANVDGLEN